MLNKENLEKLGNELGIPDVFLKKCLDKYSNLTEEIYSLSCSLADFNNSASSYKLLSTKIQNDPNGEMMFLCFLIGLFYTKEGYIKKDISIETYYYTVSTFKECIINEFSSSGTYKFTAGWWVYRHVCLRMFHINQLEFELYDDENDHVVALHIPPKADLSDDAIDKTILEAESFMQKYFPHYYKLRWTLYSWLIDPKITDLLPETSKIKGFSKRFEFVSRHDNDQEILQWIFHTSSDTRFEDLEEKTSLQKLVKGELLKGHKFGCAFSILKQGEK